MQKKPAFNSSKPHLNAQGLQGSPTSESSTYGGVPHSFHMGHIRVSDFQWHA